MSAEVVHRWSVGSRTVTLRVSVSRSGVPGQARLTWWPDRPARLSAAEWCQLREGQRAALAEVAEVFGQEPAVTEVAR